MEFGEGIAALVKFMEKEKKIKCEFKPEKTHWNANLNGSSDSLGNRFGNKPHANKESELSKDAWPSQAHHLIPHLTLLRHDVADFLKTADF